jgi:hypothetical protein
MVLALSRPFALAYIWRGCPRIWMFDINWVAIVRPMATKDGLWGQFVCGTLDRCRGYGGG